MTAAGETRTVRTDTIREVVVRRPDGRTDIVELVRLHQVIGTWGGGEDDLPPVEELRLKSTRQEVVANDDGTFIVLSSGMVLTVV
jgi:hypothetical protein